MRTEDSEIVVITPTDSYEVIKRAVSDAGIPYESAEVTMIPQTTSESRDEKPST